MSLRYATVDANGVIASDVQLDGRTCECCNTGMAMTSGGPFIVYRDRSGNDIRDVAVVRKTASGWSVPLRVHADEWKIDGCPVNGPQADAIGNAVVAAWFTAPQDQGRAYVIFSRDGGLTFGKPIRIDEGKPVGRMDVVLLDADTAVVTWLEQTGSSGEIRARRVTRNGPLQPAMTIAETSTARAAGFPRIARKGRDVYFAWTGATKRIHIRRERF
jgi:hypothetical protein